MRKAPGTLAALLCGLATTAQEGSSTVRPFTLQGVYATVGLGSEWAQDKSNVILPITSTAGLTVLTKSGLGLAVHHRSTELNAAGVPADFQAGSTLLGNGIPVESVGITTVSAVYKVQPFSVPLLRVSVEVGPSWMSYDRAHFTPQDVTSSNSGFLSSRSSNYSYTRINERSMGLTAAMRIEAPLCRYVGMEYGVWSNLNRTMDLVGGEFALTIGVVRKRIDPKGAGRL